MPATSRIKRVFYPIIFALVVALLGGCAGVPDANSEPEIYYPKLPPGIHTIEEAKQELAVLCKEIHRIDYKLSASAYPADDKVDRLDRKYPRMSVTQIFKTDTYWGIYKRKGGTIDVFDDRIDFPTLPLYYRELSKYYTIQVKNNIDNIVFISNHVILWVDNKDVSQKIADTLYFIQKNIEKYNDEKLDIFKEKAAQYRDLKKKPPISEQQREYIVQADALTQRKDYDGAIDLYLKVVALDLATYPEAYFNLALLFAQKNHFISATDYMRQYQILAPDAQDARSAQDKIYEWKLMAP